MGRGSTSVDMSGGWTDKFLAAAAWAPTTLVVVVTLMILAA